jgi:hypothetical protein
VLDGGDFALRIKKRAGIISIPAGVQDLVCALSSLE